MKNGEDVRFADLLSFALRAVSGRVLWRREQRRGSTVQEEGHCAKASRNVRTRGAEQ